MKKLRNWFGCMIFNFSAEAQYNHTIMQWRYHISFHLSLMPETSFQSYYNAVEVSYIVSSLIDARNIIQSDDTMESN